jgi:hypothetical protein
MGTASSIRAQRNSRIKHDVDGAGYRGICEAEVLAVTFERQALTEYAPAISFAIGSA